MFLPDRLDLLVARRPNDLVRRINERPRLRKVLLHGGHGFVDLGGPVLSYRVLNDDVLVASRRPELRVAATVARRRGRGSEARVVVDQEFRREFLEAFPLRGPKLLQSETKPVPVHGAKLPRRPRSTAPLSFDWILRLSPTYFPRSGAESGVSANEIWTAKDPVGSGDTTSAAERPANATCLATGRQDLNPATAIPRGMRTDDRPRHELMPYWCLGHSPTAFAAAQPDQKAA